ncbi:uncharacterized protein LOC105204459 [Solenopsis invicta]|uniref:uncharacterized protein LOC105204459 n=1 Tax=Solenopsis invicta TaxID=13686 RepID=UPI00193C9026|nr:uncharacterized protein LOC105204459 [Solenopsis invicta]
MGVYCLLCGNRNKTVSYHRFPKNKQDREKWLSFCGIKEQDLNTATFLCSNHFKEEDLKKKLNCLITNPGAIPSIKTQKRKKSNTTDKCLPPIKKHNLGEVVSIVEADASNSPTAANTIFTLIEDSPTAANTRSTLIEDSPTAANTIFTLIEDSPTAANTTSTLIEVNRRTLPMTVPEPRYVGDIRTPHLATPRRAKRAVALTRRVISQYSRNIKTLQQSQNRLRARNGSPDIMHEILKRKKGLKKKYSEELRKFALTLNFYSSKAYEYVRKTFKNLLPERSTIRKWYSVINGRPGFTDEIMMGKGITDMLISE